MTTAEEEAREMTRVKEEFKATITTIVDGKLATFKSDVERLVKERTAKMPGLIASGATADNGRRITTARLADDASFRTWLSQPRSWRSSLAIEVPFRLETRAAVPITGMVNTTHVGGIIGPPSPALRLGEIVTRMPAIGSAVEFTRETAIAGGADVQVEGALKASTTLTFANTVAQFQTVAVFTKASLQSLADVPSLQSWLDMRLGNLVLAKEENLMVSALLAAAIAPDAAYVPGTGATALDHVAGALSQLSAAGSRRTW